MPGSVIVKVRRAQGAADVPLPRKMTAHAAGFDVSAAVATTVTIAPGEIRLVPCGFHLAIPPGYEGQMRPRSGMASRHGITMINTPGTIDADYRGEVQAALINLGSQPFEVTRGMRIAQLLISPVPDVEMLEVSELEETQRGEGGFGHTGH